MRRMFLYIYIVGVGLGLFGIDVEVEQVLDAPPSNFGTFFGDSAAYAANGELLFAGSHAFNIFTCEDNKWKRLIDQYKSDELNHFEKWSWSESINHLYNSSVPNEFVYEAIGKSDEEHYRVFINNKNELQAEWVDKEYYDSHLLMIPGWGYSLGGDRTLKNGMRLERIKMSDTGEGSLYQLNIVDEDDKVIKNITSFLPEAFVEDTKTITVNPNKDRIAAVVSFIPEENSPYREKGYRRLKKLVIWEITYNDEFVEK